MSGAWWALVALCGLIATYAGSHQIARCHQRLGDPGSVILEFTRSADRVEQVKAIWGSRLPNAQAAIRWDYLMIVGYTALLVGLVGLTSPAVSALVGVRLAVVFAAAAAVPVVAGLCDTVENVLSLHELAHPATPRTAGLTVDFATTKWVLVTVAAAWLVLAAIPMAVVRW